ncbi:hypothetical protein M569_16929 [Genlisea aurea]|uniref:Uncharacterized protein n=1 Tax=Genlisea aurea TaxID=192259 RepID=S8D5K0_9LAMI|nr:hypothetical protein M569_16929 [Genlisea aurea]
MHRNLLTFWSQKSLVSPLKNANSLVNRQGITFTLPGESQKIRTPQGLSSESPRDFLGNP